jgi:hypothetical protein
LPINGASRGQAVTQANRAMSRARSASPGPTKNHAASFIEAPRGNVLAATGEFASSFCFLFKKFYTILSNQL